MAKLIFTEGFVEDLAHVIYQSKRQEVIKSVALLEEFPHLGSSNLPDSILEHYGKHVRKLAIYPFDVIYEYSDPKDEVYIYALIHQRQAY